MFRRPRTFNSTAQPIRLVVLVAALLGVFAMHGLAAHGAMHPPVSGDSVAGAVVDAVHVEHGGATVEALTEGSVSVGARDAPDHGDSALMALCLALLATALIVLLGLRVRGRLTRLRGPERATSTTLRLAARRDRDPPCLPALSIQRC